MANNRLYILDTETGEKLMVAKSFGNGWQWWPEATPLKINEWLLARDPGVRDEAASYGNTDNSASMLRLITENEPET